jgi:hypothetical protein
MNYKFAQLMQSPGKRSRAVSEIYVAQPDAQREYLAGKLFLLLEIELENSLAQRIASFLIDSIVHNFYQNEKLLLREKIPSIRVDNIFESALAETNKALAELIQEERLPINFESINILAGVVFEEELYITNSGKNRAFLIFLDKASGQYDLFDLFPKENQNNSDRKHRLFSDVICGRIPAKGALFISNEALPEYISKKQICGVVSSLPPSSAIEQIRHILNSINTYIAFAGLIIKSTSLEKTTETVISKTPATSSDSIAQLNKTEDLTDALLTPSGMISPKKWVKLLSIGSYAKNIPNKMNPPLFLKDKIIVKRKSSFEKISSLSSRFFKNLFIAGTNLLRSLQIRPLFSRLLSLIPGTSYLVLAKKRVFSFLGQKKLLLFLSACFIIAALISINKTKEKQEIADSEQRYQEIISQIEQKQNQADASLLYNNKQGAKELFNEIDRLITELPQNNEEQKTKYAEIRQKYDIQLEKIRLVVRTDSATEIADLANLNSRADAKNIELEADTGKLYAADPNQKSIYIIDLLENAPSTITDLDRPIGNLAHPFRTDREDDKRIYYLSSNGILAFDLGESAFVDIASELKNPDALRGAATYNSILYVLDTSDNEIYKHEQNGQEYGLGTPWLNEKADFSRATDIAIDGQIYVLLSDGTVLRYLRGSPTEFKLGLIDPPFTQADKLHVSETDKYIYIMESGQKRLAVFEKNGDFRLQYTGQNLDKLKDFAVDEEKKLIYFLAGNKILKLNTE